MAAIKSPGTWLSRLASLGLIGVITPHHYREVLGAIWDNRKALPYAWNVLNHGVCDRCSLGISGVRDNVLDRIDLCMIRLKFLKLNTMGPLEPSALANPERLRRLGPEKLHRLGRIPYPMLRHRNDKGFVRITWEDAFDLIAKSARATVPNEMGFFATSHRLTNEVYYVFQKLARTLGTNNVNLCSGQAQDPGVSGLKNTLGLGASTCSFSDLIGTDLLVLFGIDLAGHQPITTKYLQRAKQHGTRIVVVNPAEQFGMEHVAAASHSWFSNKLRDDLFRVRAGGDIAFINGVLKTLLATDGLDRQFIARHTNGVVKLKESLERQPWELLEQRCGLARAAMERFAAIYSNAKSAVFVFGTGVTQHEFCVENVQAVVNLALARGMLGREKCGILPLAGNRGNRGGDECGSVPDKFPGGFVVNEENARRFSNLWRHPVSSVPGLTIPQLLDAAHRRELKFLYSIGADLLETIPNHTFVTEAIARVAFRVHQDIVVNRSMLIAPQEAVLLLPGQTCYEQRTGGTFTSAERRIRLTPEIPGHRVGEALPEWEIAALIGRKTMSNGELLFPFNDTQSIREEIARVLPIYRGIETLGREGDQLQWGGPYLYKDGFSNMPNSRARFTVLEPPDLAQHSAALDAKGRKVSLWPSAPPIG